MNSESFHYYFPVVGQWQVFESENEEDVEQWGKYGLRNTLNKHQYFDLASSDATLPKNLILGGSTAWGRGINDPNELLASRLTSLADLFHFTLAQPSDTIRQQAYKLKVVINNHPRLKASIKKIICLIGCNETYYLHTSSYMTPFSYCADFEDYLFNIDSVAGATVEICNDIQTSTEEEVNRRVGRERVLSKLFTEETVGRLMESGLVTANPLYHRRIIKNIHSRECFELIRDAYGSEIKDAINIINTTCPEAELVIIQQPSAIANMSLCSDEEYNLIQNWLSKITDEQQGVWRVMASGTYDHSAFVLKQIASENGKYINLMNFRNDVDQDIFVDDCHLNSYGNNALAERIAQELND